MTLYSERKRLGALAEREASGVSLWSMAIPPEARVKLVKILEMVLEKDGWSGRDDWGDLARVVRYARGVNQIAGSASAETDIRAAVREGDFELVADVLEAAIRYVPDRLREALRDEVNSVLASYRVAFELVGEAVVEFESREMHVEVVAPALTLLGGDRQFAAVEAAYQSALREIADPNGAADAITDAGTALQEMLEARGCEGNTIGSLLKSARSRGILNASDKKLEAGIADIIDWVSADRSTKGDVHKSSDAIRADAWLTIHVVGALILRLANAAPRGLTSLE